MPNHAAALWLALLRLLLRKLGFEPGCFVRGDRTEFFAVGDIPNMLIAHGMRHTAAWHAYLFLQRDRFSDSAR